MRADVSRGASADRFPDHDILAEELSSGPMQAASARYRWVFDPLDGTTNYAHGLPVFCASLALEIDGRAEVGAIYDPTRKELFTGERGQGSFLNGTRLQVSETGHVARLAARDRLSVRRAPEAQWRCMTMFGAFLGQARAVRRLGSAALDLCYVAAGRFDGFWEQSLRPWDVAAGALIVEEAGGRITGMDGTRFDPAAAHLVASNGQIHEAMLRVIAARQTVKRKG